MVRRGLTTTLRLLAATAAALVVVAAVLFWRLASGPIALTPLTPYMEAALTPRLGELSVEVGETQLRLDQEGQALELVAVDVRGLGPGGDLVLRLPEVEIDLSLDALLRHALVAPSELEATAPEVVLARDASGRIRLGGLGGGGGGRPQLDLHGLAAHVVGPPDPDRPLTYLELVRLSGGRLHLVDEISGQTFEAQAAQLSVSRDGDRLSLGLSFEVPRGDRHARILISAGLEPQSDRLDFVLQFADVAPADLGDVLPAARAELDGLDLLLQGRIGGTLGLTGGFSPLRFYVASSGGTVRLPDLLAAEVELGALESHGQLALDPLVLQLDDLELAAYGAALQAAGRIAWQEEGPGISLDLAAQRVRAEHLGRLWPPGAGKDARKWVLENVLAGVVPQAEARIELQPGEHALRPLPDGAIAASFAFEEISVRYFKTMPPLEGMAGEARFTGQTMNLRVERGHVDDLEVQSGTVVITGIGIKGRDTTQLEVVGDVAGPVPQALALIDHEPLGFASRLQIAPAAAGGSARVDLRIGMPLHRDLEPDEVRVNATAALADASAQDLLGIVDVSEGELQLEVDRESMQVTGEARVASIPAVAIEWRESFGEDVDVRRRYRLRAAVEEPSLRELGFSPPVPFGGSIYADVVGTETAGTRTLDADLDLEQAALDVPELAWRKPAGEAGALQLTVLVEEAAPIQIPAFELAAAGVQASGSLELEREPVRLATLSLDRFVHGPQRGSAHIVRQAGGGYRITVDAESLDLGALLEQREGLTAEGEGEPTPFEVTLRAQRVILDQQALRGVNGELARDRAGWRWANLGGILPGGGNLTLTLAPEDGHLALSLVASDAGDLLRTLDQTHRITGGQLALEASIFQQVPDLQSQGTLRISDFTLLDAPILARLLTLASFTGIGNLLGGEGIFMDRLRVPFAIEERVLTITDGRLSGSQVGLTFEGTIDLGADQLDLNGTVVPVYAINRAIGSIPVIGDFLAGSEGEGAFAATFWVQGSPEEPQMSVNPLAVLAPGFIRELFSGLFSGTLEPPDVPVSDDD